MTTLRFAQRAINSGNNFGKNLHNFGRDLLAMLGGLLRLLRLLRLRGMLLGAL
jgi:hypothetical protein